MATHVVTVFLRNGTDVLLLHRSDAVGSYAGQWGAVAGHAEGDPDTLARTEIQEETGFEDAVEFVRRGDAFAVHDDEHGTWIVHPYLFDCNSRAVTANEETTEYEWVPATEIRRRDAVPQLWQSYDAVRPTVETVASDDEHGSAYLSLRALEVLCDEAALARDGGDWKSLASTARSLCDAQPDMAAVANRVNHAMHDADRTPASVEASTRAVAADAADADDRAARGAASHLGGADAVFTFSRSRTVRAAIDAVDPDRVLVAESRPGGEGVAVAESLADECEVTLTTDANIPVAVSDADVVLVGADAVFPDSRVVNKVGTRAAALAARDSDVPAVAVCATDKIATEARDVGGGDPSALYDGDADVEVRNPIFEAVPAGLLDVVTEDGLLDADAIAAAADERRTWTDWE